MDSPERQEQSGTPQSYVCDPLRRTRKRRVNPLPQTKKQYKQARRGQIKANKQLAKKEEINKMLADIWDKIIYHLRQE